MTPKNDNPHARRIGKLLFFLCSLLCLTAFCWGIDPGLFQGDTDNLTVTRIVSWTLAPMFIGLGLFMYDIFIKKGLSWEWWRILLYGWFAVGGLGLMISALPNFSMNLYIVTLIWGIFTIVSIILWRWQGLRFHRIIAISYFPSFFFIVATRLWIFLFQFHWIWFTLFLGLYLLAWLLPTLFPRISKIVFRDLFDEDKGRRRLLLMYISFIVVSLIGLFGANALADHLWFLLLAILFSIISIMFAQLFAHQVFNDDPFAGLFGGQ
jgi:hypothetical protein